jgi:hypothetical protein
MLHTHRIVGFLKPRFQLVVEVIDGSDGHEGERATSDHSPASESPVGFSAIDGARNSQRSDPSEA